MKKVYNVILIYTLLIALVFTYIFVRDVLYSGGLSDSDTLLGLLIVILFAVVSYKNIIYLNDPNEINLNVSLKYNKFLYGLQVLQFKFLGIVYYQMCGTKLLIYLTTGSSLSSELGYQFYLYEFRSVLKFTEDKDFLIGINLFSLVIFVFFYYFKIQSNKFISSFPLDSPNTKL